MHKQKRNTSGKHCNAKLQMKERTTHTNNFLSSLAPMHELIEENRNIYDYSLNICRLLTLQNK